VEMALLLGLDFFTSFLRVIGPQYWGVWSEKERKTRGVCQCIFKAKEEEEEELWKLKYFTMQKYNLQKNPIKKKNQNPSRYYYNSIATNLKFQHKPKYHLSRILM
jgi:hypothetical protein